MHHKGRNLLVELLRQDFNADGILSGIARQIREPLLIQVDLREYLIRERAVHDARRVPGRIAQIHQTSLGEQQQVVVGCCVAHDFVYLRLDLFPLPHVSHVGGVDLIVKVTNIADHCPRLQCAQHRRSAHVEIAGRGHQHVGGAQQVGVDAAVRAVVDAINKGRYHLKTVHTGLHGANGVAFGDPHDHAFLSK